MGRGKPRVLFLCTGNSCRSQMAEGWARHLHAGVFEAVSAGTQPQGLDPLAVRGMEEAGVDITGHTSKAIAQVEPESLDLVVTVCDSAREHCPVFLGDTQIMHQSFDDPPRLAREARDEDEAMVHYRRVRDEIREFVGSLPFVIRDLIRG